MAVASGGGSLPEFCKGFQAKKMACFVLFLCVYLLALALCLPALIGYGGPALVDEHHPLWNPQVDLSSSSSFVSPSNGSTLVKALASEFDIECRQNYDLI